MSRVTLLSFFITLKRRMVATRVLCCWLNLSTCLRWRLDNSCVQYRFRPQMQNIAVGCVIAQSALEFSDSENDEKKKERKKEKEESKSSKTR